MSAAPVDDPRAFLAQLYWAAVQRALPSHTMAAWLPQPPKGRTLVLGAGKASAAMAHAVEALWPAHAALSGLVVTRYQHTPPRPPGVLPRIAVVEAAHPVPDAAGVDAARHMLALTQGLTADDLVLCLVSGGGSALLTLPAQGLELADKQRISRELLASGATIAEMNTVRKHLSRIKGGRLAQACGAAQVLTLAISDVPGDDVGTIASGPSVADNTTCAQALQVLHRYRIGVPSAVCAALENGLLETPKPGDAVFKGHAVHCIATPRQSLEAAAAAARAAGPGNFVWGWPRRCKARVGCTPWRLIRMALTVWKTTPVPGCCPTPWHGHNSRGCGWMRTWIATMPGGILQPWATCLSPGPPPPM